MILIFEYNKVEYLVSTKILDNDVWVASGGEKTMVFIDEYLYSKLSPEDKSNMTTTSDKDYSPDDMLNIDVLYVIIDRTFNINAFMALVEEYKQSKHSFGILKEYKD